MTTCYSVKDKEEFFDNKKDVVELHDLVMEYIGFI